MEISVADTKARIDRGDALHLLDVREPDEVAICRIEGSEHIPMMELFTGMTRTTAGKDDAIVIYCHTGLRSLEASMYLSREGFTNVRSLAGGIHEWAAKVDPTMPQYGV